MSDLAVSHCRRVVSPSVGFRGGLVSQQGHLARVEENPIAARLPVMRRVLAILLLALLPIHFTWAAATAHCAHKARADAPHFSHHQNQADAGPSIYPVGDAIIDPQSYKAPGTTDLDCGHCHGTCGLMVTGPPALPGALPSAPPSATLDETGSAQAPTRPERPQWLRLA